MPNLDVERQIEIGRQLENILEHDSVDILWVRSKQGGNIRSTQDDNFLSVKVVRNRKLIQQIASCRLTVLEILRKHILQLKFSSYDYDYECSFSIHSFESTLGSKPIRIPSLFLYAWFRWAESEWNFVYSNFLSMLTNENILKRLEFNFLAHWCNRNFSLQVSWVRRRDDQLHLITFGSSIYISDSRYSLEFKEPNDWQLHIQYVNERDEGQFECQINTSPPLILTVHLEVIGEYFLHVFQTCYVRTWPCGLRIDCENFPIHFILYFYILLRVHQIPLPPHFLFL